MKHIRWKNLEHESLRYALLKVYVKFWHNHVFYRKVIALNTHKIPDDSPVIFAPNHENAAMDGLAILCTTKGQPIFLARSDIFNKRIPALLLTFIKIMPIYRIRDGISSLQNNDIIFRKTISILKKLRPLVILPEGNHSEFKRLRALKKGISRIAFQAEEASGYQLGLKIVPVGLDYGHIKKYKTDLIVNYGNPIDVSDFFESYRENPQKGMNALREVLAEGIRNLMVHIRTESFYHTYIGLLDLYLSRMKKRLGYHHRDHSVKIRSDQKLVEVLDQVGEKEPEALHDLDQKTKRYLHLRDRLGLRNWLFEKGSFPLPGLVLHACLLVPGFPVFLTGTLANYIPYHLPVWVAGKFKDQVFSSTVRYVVSLFLFPLYYFLLLMVLWIASGELLLVLLLLILFALAGMFGFWYYISWKKFMGKWRFMKNLKSRHSDLTEASMLRTELLNRLDSYVEKYAPAQRTGE